MRKSKKERIDSFLGRESQFEGKLSFSGTVRIDGHFRGEISATGNLIVGNGGKVEADIKAGAVICSGEIHGRINAATLVDFRVPGKMFGDIQAPTVMLQEGVVFEGACRTLKQKPNKPNKLRKVRRMGRRAKQSTAAAGVSSSARNDALQAD